jgi:ribosomal protein L37AE/L43A
MTREKSDSFPISISQLKPYSKNNLILPSKKIKSSIENQSFSFQLSDSSIKNIHQDTPNLIPPPLNKKKYSINNHKETPEQKPNPSMKTSHQSGATSGASSGASSGGTQTNIAGKSMKPKNYSVSEEMGENNLCWGAGSDSGSGAGMNVGKGSVKYQDDINDLIQYEICLERNFPCVEKSFSDNLDILELHDFLMKKFEFEKETKSRLLVRQMEMENQKLKGPLYLIEIKIIKNDIKEMELEYNNLVQNIKMNEYKKITNEIFEVYNQIGHKKKIISFNNTKQNKKEDVINTRLRKFLIEKYLDIFKRYHEIHIIHTQNLKTICPVCQHDLTKVISEEAGIVVCPKCNTEKTMLIHTSIISEVKYTNSKDGYEDRENFWKALQRFQGKQNNHIPERLYKELDEYFKSFGLAIGKEICSMELTKKGTRGNTSRGMMFKALSESNNSVFYEDVNLICHLYWGWLLPDISADEEQIMNDYDMTQEVFKKIPKDRRSSLNAQYRLWQHLRIRGYRYPIDDFKIVKTPDILVEHDRIMKIMCDECNLPFISAL